MTPFDLAFGEGGPRLMLAGIALAGVLTLVAAALDILLERAGGPDPATRPDWFAERGPAIFVFIGMPALALAALGAFSLTLVLGGNPEQSGLPSRLQLLLDLCVVVAIVACGVGSPLTQHWGLAIAAFAVGIGIMFALLFVTNLLPFTEDGALAYPERFVFALTVALLLITFIGAAAALVALAVTSIRTYRQVRRLTPSARRQERA
jgi:hypothetical protein